MYSLKYNISTYIYYITNLTLPSFIQSQNLHIQKDLKIKKTNTDLPQQVFRWKIYTFLTRLVKTSQYIIDENLSRSKT